MSSSSDYSDSDDGRKGKVSDNDSDNSSKNKKRPMRTTNSKAIIESAGSSDSDDSKSDSESCSDSENEKATSSRKRKAGNTAKKGAVTKRKRAVSDDSDRGDMDDELFVDEEDRKRVMNMNEKDREQEIFNRMEQLEMRRTREQIEQKLAAAKNAAVEGEKREKKKDKRKRDEKKRKIDESDSEDEKEASPTLAKAESDDSEIDAEFHRPSELDKKRKQKSAMADLLQKRKDKEKKEAKKAALSIDAVFGKEESDSSSSSSSSSSSTASSRSSSRNSSPARRQDSDDEKKIVKKDVEFLQELSRARLSRYKLSRIVHAPFFARSVVGCFVRIGIGMVAGKSRYRISQITDVVETAKVYNLEKTRTNKGIKLKYGKGERVYRLEFVSNTEFPCDEFEEWLRVSKEEGTVPNMDLIEKKEADIKRAMEYNYTHSDIDSMIKEKARFTKTPKNFAMTKGELMKKKEYAEQSGDHAEVQRLQREIEEVDSRADQLDKKRSADISAITWINQRNRNKMKEQFLGDNVQIDMGHQDDPFTRKKDRMKVVSGSKALANQGDQDQTASSSSYLPKTVPTVAKIASGVNSSFGTNIHTSKSGNDLFDLHNNITKIDLDIDLGKLSSNRAVQQRMEDTIHDNTNSSNVPLVEQKGRPLSLEDYRRRRAANAQ